MNSGIISFNISTANSPVIFELCDNEDDPTGGTDYLLTASGIFGTSPSGGPLTVTHTFTDMGQERCSTWTITTPSVVNLIVVGLIVGGCNIPLAITNDLKAATEAGRLSWHYSGEAQLTRMRLHPLDGKLLRGEALASQLLAGEQAGSFDLESLPLGDGQVHYLQLQALDLDGNELESRPIVYVSGPATQLKLLYHPANRQYYLSQDATYTLWDLKGQQVGSGKGKEIDTRGLPAGLYALVTPGKSFKLVVQQ